MTKQVYARELKLPDVASLTCNGAATQCSRLTLGCCKHCITAQGTDSELLLLYVHKLEAPDRVNMLVGGRIKS